MKRLVSLLLCLMICVMLCSCRTVTQGKPTATSDKGDKLHYNGHTYIRDRGNKTLLDPVEISKDSHYFLFYLMKNEIYRADQAEDPRFITAGWSSSPVLFIREDISLDRTSRVFTPDSQEPLYFRISDVIAESGISYSSERYSEFQDICSFAVRFEEYPCIGMYIFITERNGKQYMQMDEPGADYYEITDESFIEDIYRVGLDKLDLDADLE